MADPTPAPGAPPADDSTKTAAAELAATKAKLEEFRESNRAMHAQLKQLQDRTAAFGDIDPETVKQAVAAMGQLKNNEEAELVKAGKIDEVVKRRTTAMQEQYQKQVAEAVKKADVAAKREAELIAEYGGLRLRSELDRALDEKKIRVRQGAKDDLMLRAERMFRLGDDRKLQSTQTDKDGNPLSVATWVEALVETAGHLFEGGEGGGTKPGFGGGGPRKVVAAQLSPAELSKLGPEINAGKVVLV